MTARSNLWFPPASPSAFDDEFDDATATVAAWDLSYTPVATIIDPLTTFSTAGAIRESINVIRPSWYLYQLPAESVNRYISRAPNGASELSDGTYWCRLKSFYGFGAVSDNSQCFFGLAATSAGDPDQNNDGYTVYLHENDPGAVEPSALGFSGGVSRINLEMSDVEGSGLHFEYAAILKDSNTYHLFLGSGPGSWVHLASDTYPGAAVINRVHFGGVSVNVGTPGNITYGCDFVRFIAPLAGGELVLP